jgi:hypothetical protein
MSRNFLGNVAKADSKMYSVEIIKMRHKTLPYCLILKQMSIFNQANTHGFAFNDPICGFCQQYPIWIESRLDVLLRVRATQIKKEFSV